MLYCDLHQAHSISRHFLSTNVDHRRRGDFLTIRKGVWRGRQVLHEISAIIGALRTKSSGQELDNTTLAMKHVGQN